MSGKTVIFSKKIFKKFRRWTVELSFEYLEGSPRCWNNFMSLSWRGLKISCQISADLRQNRHFFWKKFSKIFRRWTFEFFFSWKYNRRCPKNSKSLSRSGLKISCRTSADVRWHRLFFWKKNSNQFSRWTLEFRFEYLKGSSRCVKYYISLSWRGLKISGQTSADVRRNRHFFKKKFRKIPSLNFRIWFSLSQGFLKMFK